MRMVVPVVAVAALAWLLPAAPTVAGETLDAVKERGFVQCGVNTGLAGFSIPDDAGTWSGFDTDVCRAIAAAVLGDAHAVEFTPLTAKERFAALQSGEIDVLSRNTSWTLTHDAALDFAGITYYDGQGFMVPRALGVRSALELDGSTVCVLGGTTTELNLDDYFRVNNMSLSRIVFERADEIRAAYESGRCEVVTSDLSQLYALRIGLSHPDDQMLLPEVISKEPLGPVVRHGDDEWADVVRWTLYAMLEGEELGVSSSNVAERRANAVVPAVRRLLGAEGELGAALGLPADFAAQVIGQVGNYGEVFERNLGHGTPLGIDRGFNALWINGGLQYAMPAR